MHSNITNKKCRSRDQRVKSLTRKMVPITKKNGGKRCLCKKDGLNSIKALHEK